jgi:hypothetical protein
VLSPARLNEQLREAQEAEQRVRDELQVVIRQSSNPSQLGGLPVYNEENDDEKDAPPAAASVAAPPKFESLPAFDVQSLPTYLGHMPSALIPKPPVYVSEMQFPKVATCLLI